MTSFLAVNVTIGQRKDLCNRTKGFSDRQYNSLAVDQLRNGDNVTITDQDSRAIFTRYDRNTINEQPHRLHVIGKHVILIVNRHIRLLHDTIHGQHKGRFIVVHVGSLSKLSLYTELIIDGIPELLDDVTVRLKRHPHQANRRYTIINTVSLLPFSHQANLLVSSLTINRRFIHVHTSYAANAIRGINSNYHDLNDTIADVSLMGVNILHVAFDHAQFLRRVNTILNRITRLRQAFHVDVVIPATVNSNNGDIHTICHVILLTVRNPTNSTRDIAEFICLIPYSYHAEDEVQTIPQGIIAFLVRIRSKYNFLTKLISRFTTGKIVLTLTENFLRNLIIRRLRVTTSPRTTIDKGITLRVTLKGGSTTRPYNKQIIHNPRIVHATPYTIVNTNIHIIIDSLGPTHDLAATGRRVQHVNRVPRSLLHTLHMVHILHYLLDVPEYDHSRVINSVVIVPPRSPAVIRIGNLPIHTDRIGRGKDIVQRIRRLRVSTYMVNSIWVWKENK